MSTSTITIRTSLSGLVYKGEEGFIIHMDEDITFHYLKTHEGEHVVCIATPTEANVVLSHFNSYKDVLKFLYTFKHLYKMTPRTNHIIREVRGHTIIQAYRKDEHKYI